MIYFYTGKTGDGKSALACRKILRTLQFTNRVVLTNLPFVREEIFKYLVKQDRDTDFELERRLVFLDDVARDGQEIPDVAHFWDFRRWSTSEPDDARPSAAQAVLFVIDEAHEFFECHKQLAERGRTYIKQHRKLGDDVIFITHNANEIVLRIRDICNEFHRVRNERRRKLLCFRGYDRFKVRISYRNQEDTPNAQYDSVEFIPYDRAGIFKCYKTQAGVGIEGVRADLDVVPPGISKKWIPLAVAGIFLACAALPAIVMGAFNIAGKHALPGMMSKLAVSGVKATGHGGASGEVGVPPAADKGPAASVMPSNVLGGPLTGSAVGMAGVPTVSGLLQRNERSNPIVYLSNGHVLSSEVEAVYLDRVQCQNGTVYYFSLPPPVTVKPLSLVSSEGFAGVLPSPVSGTAVVSGSPAAAAAAGSVATQTPALSQSKLAQPPRLSTPALGRRP